jgi:hypothetical protein
MAQVALTKSQQKIMTAIKQNKWLSASEIAQITGIGESHVRTALKTKPFLDIDRGSRDTGNFGSAKYVNVYRYPLKGGKPTDEALRLAKTHTGIFGQLYWANDTYEKVSRVAGL